MGSVRSVATLVGVATIVLLVGLTRSALATERSDYRLSASRICQDFFDQTRLVDPVDTLGDSSWPAGRRAAAVALRRLARANARAGEALERLRHPRSADRSWRSMAAAHRDVGRQWSATATRVIQASSRAAAERILRVGGDRSAEAQWSFDTRARRLGINGCREYDPTVDLGLDRDAPAIARTEAHRLAAAGDPLHIAAEQLAGVTAAAIFYAPSCLSLFDEAFEHSHVRARRFARSVSTTMLFASLRPALGRFSYDLAQLPISDPVLSRGRHALAAQAAMLAGLPNPFDPCPAVERWKQAGWTPAASPRPLLDVEATAEAASNRRIIAVGRRMRALGVPSVRIRRVLMMTLFQHSLAHADSGNASNR